jgi:hypothetical protein
MLLVVDDKCVENNDYEFGEALKTKWDGELKGLKNFETAPVIYTATIISWLQVAENCPEFHNDKRDGERRLRQTKTPSERCNDSQEVLFWLSFRITPAVQL